MSGGVRPATGAACSLARPPWGNGGDHAQDEEVRGQTAHLRHRDGDPAGYEEQLFQTKAGLYFIYGQGGTTSPYAEGEDITPLSEAKAQAWLKEQPEGERA